MHRVGNRTIGLVCALAVVGAAAGMQPEVDLSAPADSEAMAQAEVEAYMERLGLRELLADQLAARLAQTGGAAKRALAERMAKIYVELLEQAKSDGKRREWEQRSRQLLQMVPEADSHELRINLARAIYTRAEEIAERGRLRLANAEEMAEAERMLRSIRAELLQTAAGLNTRVAQYERLEESRQYTETLTADLAEARRLRSVAFYYAGWTDCYLSYLSRADSLALEAMKSFGWLLNSRGGVPASLERLPAGLLKYEHIARAAIGCALSASQRGHDTEALRWLDAVASTEGVGESMKEQLLARRITVLANAKRWADLERLIRLERKSDRKGGGENVEPLGVLAARLLAVVSLEADRALAGEALEQLSRAALGDLVARGDIAQVLDIVQRYGTAPIGDRGFIVNYVRGYQLYERAREAQRAAGENIDSPTATASVANLYREAASLLEAALKQEDAGTFGAERARALTQASLCLFYGGEAVRAADRFLEAAREAGDERGAEEPTWLALVALDYAARAGDESAGRRRDELAAEFLRTYADSERAVQLLVGLGGSGVVEPEGALKILLGVARSSPTYEAARRHAARLLFGLYRRGQGEGREYAALRFVTVAEEVLQFERRAAIEGSGEAASAAAERGVLLVRQVLDALLGMAVPDVARAAAALGTLDELARARGLDLSEHEQELEYRRVQILLAQGDDGGAKEAAERLRQKGGPFADGADRLMYRRAVLAWQRAGSRGGAVGQEVLSEIVTYGERLIAASGSGPAAMSDGAVLSVHVLVADAAARLWEQTGDDGLRELSQRLDSAVLVVQPRAESSLRRLTRTAEAGGDYGAALECWRVLGAALEVGSADWFETRYHQLRLLKRIDPVRASELLRQHRVLYPDMGPAPWGERIAELERPGSAPAAPAGPGGGGPR